MTPHNDQAVREALAFADTVQPKEAYIKVLAAEVRRLSPPEGVPCRVWDAETIKDAPEGWYHICREEDPVFDGWDFMQYGRGTVEEFLKGIRRPEPDGTVIAAFGPLPQPPEGSGKVVRGEA
jgi:hypothetical protein